MELTRQNRDEMSAALAAAQAKTRTARYVVACREKGCRHALAVELTLTPSADYYAIRVRWDLSPSTTIAALRDGACPDAKHRRMALSPIVGRVTETKCGPRCWNARYAECECQCGGARHAQGHGK